MTMPKFTKAIADATAKKIKVTPKKPVVKKAGSKAVSPVKKAPKKVSLQAAAKKKISVKKVGSKVRSDHLAPAPARKPRVFFSEVTLAKILDQVADGIALRTICEAEGMPSRKAVYEWIAADKDVERRYTVALQQRAEDYVHETIAIADESSNDTYTDQEGEIRTNTEVIARSKLRVETRMKYAALIAPKKYGTHSTMEIDLTVKLTEAETDDRIAALMRKAAGGR
jgi:hypothetical protein